MVRCGIKGPQMKRQDTGIALMYDEVEGCQRGRGSIW